MDNNVGIDCGIRGVGQVGESNRRKIGTAIIEQQFKKKKGIGVKE